MNKAIKYLTGDRTILISAKKLKELGITTLKTTDLCGYECHISRIEISETTIKDKSINISKAFDAAMLVFLKGENTMVNMSNKTFKNMITIKIDENPLVKVIMGNLYEKAEPRNIQNERVLSTKWIESELILHNFSMILKN